MNTPTFQAKPSDVTRKWYVLDASETTLGRLSTLAAELLIGKQKPMFTKHIDCGDYVVVVNAKNLVVTGNKLEDKLYHNHSGFPGGLRTRSLKEIMESDPTEVIMKSVRGMLPVNKLRPARLERLKIYAGAEHFHTAQKPITLTIKKGER